MQKDGQDFEEVICGKNTGENTEQLAEDGGDGCFVQWVVSVYVLM